MWDIRFGLNGFQHPRKATQQIISQTSWTERFSAQPQTIRRQKHEDTQTIRRQIYWTSFSDSRLSTDEDHRHPPFLHLVAKYLPYPDNPLIKQYSAEYWIMDDLMTPPQHRVTSFAKRVLDPRLADVVFVPFFATLSAKMQLANKDPFRK
ncbi:hypothetical protein V8G54_033255 [Vigna mungo]|uniref:Uncharacterized protein n=1 Tax=Vigna mungo TaxID=3915 RepID=A0AAQ3RIN9_VIGMU